GAELAERLHARGIARADAYAVAALGEERARQARADVATAEDRPVRHWDYASTRRRRRVHAAAAAATASAASQAIAGSGVQPMANQSMKSLGQMCSSFGGFESRSRYGGLTSKW